MKTYPNHEKEFLRVIPDKFQDRFGNIMKIILRGERSYLVEKIGNKRFKYRVLERIIQSDSYGFQEMLTDRQRYQPFDDYNEALEHFELFEKGHTPLMKAIYLQ